ncbi:MAG: S-layer homology domain-containing protein [Oscillospiraceae bacterium]
MKRFLCTVLAALLILGMLPLSAAASFSDVTDDTTAANVASLMELGVVNGMGNGKFDPNGTLTRAQFCKMAVCAMNASGEAAQYAQRSIFTDVRGAYWASGYIHLAVAESMIYGVGDGSFRPEREIKYGEAVTILMRMLGYKDADFSLAWPVGYIAGAKSCGLLRGIALTAGDSITRAQAAQMFVNLLGCDTTSGDNYASTVYSLVIQSLLIAAVGSDTIEVFDGTSLLELATADEMDSSIVGRTCDLIFSSSGKALSAIPTEDAYTKTGVTVSSTQYTYILGTDGIKYYIEEGAAMYKDGEEGSYADSWLDIPAGSTVDLYSNSKGKCILVTAGVSASSDDEAVVLTSAPSTMLNLSSLFGLSSYNSYTIYKNGAKASASELAKGDVVTYSKSTRTFYATDFRLTGYYESAYPNFDTPTKITMFGKEFTLTEKAQREAANFSKSSRVTFVFTDDFRVASVISGSSDKTAPIAYVQKLSGSTATVKFLSGLTLTAPLSNSEMSIIQTAGYLVNVTSVKPGYIQITKYNLSAPGKKLDVEAKTLGTAELSPVCRIFDSVAGDCVEEISLSDIPSSAVTSGNVLHASYDAQGRVNVLVLNDATGRSYEYGKLTVGTVTTGEGDLESENRAIGVINSADSVTYYIYSSANSSCEGEWGGVASNGVRAIKNVLLTSLKCTRSDFSGDCVIVGSKTIPIASDVVVYIEDTDTWGVTLSEARTYSDDLTAYYDKTPQTGGMVRVIVAN